MNLVLIWAEIQEGDFYKEVTVNGKTFCVVDPPHSCVRLPVLDGRPVKFSRNSGLEILTDKEIKANIENAEKLPKGVF